MDKKNRKIFIFSGMVLTFFLKASFALALEIHYPSFFGYSVDNTSSFAEFICYFFGLGTSLALIISTLSITFGGIYYLVDYGRGKFTSDAKEWIKAGITGLLIVLCVSLIAYTINPILTTCKLGILSMVNFNPNNGGTNIPPGAKVATYKEIPIGTLTETLLTRTMDCYGFDQEGNPVAGDEITADNGKKIKAPTYLNHDRADCITQLADGAQKKAQLIATLGAEITKLMNTCSCRVQDANGKDTNESKCDPKCDPEKGCFLPSGNAYGARSDCNGSCSGSSPCIGGACIQPPNTTDCCPEGVKEQIEHGSVVASFNVVGTDTCKTQEIKYAGLDEFRSKYNNDYSAIKKTVEKTVRIDNKDVEIIDTVTCSGCTKNCIDCQDTCWRFVICKENCAGFVPNEAAKAACDVNYIRCVNNKKICENNYSKCLDGINVCRKKAAWFKLPLIDQLTYFKGKIEEIKQKIQPDIDVLTLAKNTISSKSCYMTTPYVDLLTKKDKTKTDEKVILTENFVDPKTKQKVDASKYCQGFNYKNSSCFKKCNDECPDTSPQAITLYKAENNIKNAYNKRPCTQGDTTKTFSTCISSCQNECKDKCSKKYIPCSAELELCQDQCINNSQCVLDNSDSCLLDASAFKYCADQTTDQGNINYCINRAYWCKNGSDQYAGYPDCVDDTNNLLCSKDAFSASDLFDMYKNYDTYCDKCTYPYSPPDTNSVCHSSSDPTASCQELCPETTKCPTSSNCPNCPCDQIDQTLEFSVPEISFKSNAGNEGYTTAQQDVLAYQIVGPQCNGYLYNDDPLTFYCEDNWWQDPNREGLSPTPIGTERICSKAGEIPVGQTVDDAENWAVSLIKSTNVLTKNIQDIVDQTKKIGEAKDTTPIQDYCKCNAEFEDYDPICITDCQYREWTACDAPNHCWTECNCMFVPCAGSPCEQITDYLSELWNHVRQFKLDFIDFYTNAMTEPRSDIMKELAYSRQSTNQCSLTSSVYDSKTRLLDCTRAKDEIISPVNSGSVTVDGADIKVGCYGQELGREVGKSLMDNWFCCEKWSTTQ